MCNQPQTERRTAMKTQLRVCTLRTAAALALGSVVALCLDPASVKADDGSQTPSFDKRASAPTAQVSVDQQWAQIQLQDRIPGVRVDYDPLTAAPAWISRFGFLSGPTEVEVQRTGGLGLATDDPYRAVKAFLIENAGLFG